MYDNILIKFVSGCQPEKVVRRSYVSPCVSDEKACF